VQSLAFFMFGEPINRGPIASISPLANFITCELRKPSYRMRVTMLRSTFSCCDQSGTAEQERARHTRTTRANLAISRSRQGDKSGDDNTKTGNYVVPRLNQHWRKFAVLLSGAVKNYAA